MTFKARDLSKKLTSREFQLETVMYWTQRCRELLHERGNLPRDELEYLAEQAAKFKNERLREGIAGLIGWGDEERAELETFCAIALEVMKQSSPSKLREAALRVELRFLMQDKELE
jgi:hypothetical protein